MTRNKRRALREALETPHGRRQAGMMLGGKDSGAAIKRVKCPDCGRLSVWWAIAPERCGAAMCDHRNSCGWSGSIVKLLKDAGAEL